MKLTHFGIKFFKGMLLNSHRFYMYVCVCVRARIHTHTYKVKFMDSYPVHFTINLAKTRYIQKVYKMAIHNISVY